MDNITQCWACHDVNGEAECTEKGYWETCYAPEVRERERFGEGERWGKIKREGVGKRKERGREIRERRKRKREL